MPSGLSACVHQEVRDASAQPCSREKNYVLLQNYVDGSVRDVFLCSGMGGNVRCRKGSPCSTRAKGSMYPRPARLRLRAAKPPEGSAPRTFSSAPRPPLHAALAAGGASVASMERGAMARSGFACRAWLRATNGRRSAGGASLHTPLTRRASGGQGCFQHYSTTERMMALCCGTVLEVSSPPEHFTHEKLCRVTQSGIMPRRPFSGVAAIHLRR